MSERMVLSLLPEQTQNATLLGISLVKMKLPARTLILHNYKVYLQFYELSDTSAPARKLAENKTACARKDASNKHKMLQKIFFV